MSLLLTAKTVLRVSLGAANLALVFLVLCGAAFAGEQYVGRDGHAVDGYDVVSYHTQAEPLPGDPGIAAEYNGVTWLFASEANRNLFLDDPQRYVPAYDGHCAWAAARGYKARTDPLAYRLVDGVLYMNYSPRIQRRWERDIPGFIERSEANWPEIEDEPAASPRSGWF